MGAALALDYDYYRIYSRATVGGGAIVTSTAAGGALIKSTSSGGAVVKSTSSGGGTKATSSSGGGVAKSTASGGGSSQTSSSGGGATESTSSKTFAALHLMTGVPELTGSGMEYHVHEVALSGNHFNHSHTVNIPSHTHSVSIPSHTHSFDIPNHSHTVNIPNHTHEIDIPSHSHQIDIPDHQHNISIPDHTHGIDYGIFKISRMPTKVTIKVDGKAIPHTATSGDSLDLIPYLALDSEKRVQRGWHTVEITPNDLGRIHAQLMVQFFMQSRGGVNA
ncbi:hypothetical protein [Siminovitchia sp. 179-K 8D1 HS]|uniref:hypothetical protein n=1 Tax=Siminovitchia sp. 179-K 8D1 HS TaxID=3142385 RepID=UPI00399F1455